MMQPYLVMPAVGALIGWITNAVAIRMLFRPKRPLRVFGVNVGVQGILPKRKAELAKTVGETVARDLLSVEELTSVLSDQDFVQTISEMLAHHVEERLDGTIPRFVPAQLRQVLESHLRDILDRELPVLVSRMGEQFKDLLKSRLDIAEIAERRILSLDLDELERLIIKVARRELRHIEYLGGAIGFLIGFAQVALTMAK